MRTWGLDIYGKFGTERPFTTNPTVPAIKPGKLDLEDYSGPLQPRLSPLDLSKDFLIRSIKQLGRESWGLIDGMWGNRIAEKWGSKVACACRDKIWENLMVATIMYTVECLNLQGTRVEKVLKQFQTNLTQCFLTDIEVELVTPNIGILTYKTCPSLGFFEKMGQRLMLWDICWKVDAPCWVAIGKAFDPELRILPLKLPPIESKNDTACEWALWLGDIKQGDVKGYVKEMNKAAEAEGVPSDLKDYSGPLLRRIEAEYFSRELLAKAFVQASRLYRMLNAQYHSLMTELYGYEEAWERQERVWEDEASFNARWTSRALKVEGSPVEKALKCLQLNPAFGILNDVEVALKKPNEGSITCYSCTTRDYFEGVGGEATMACICGDLEQRLLQKWAQNFDPEIEVKPLVLPPKDVRHGMNVIAQVRPEKREGEVLCQWGFSLKKKK